ncbi:MAG: cupin domain-containing protein [Alphaproteobacteria bacterium]|nr:cupin domain-containing protein [Alphaproteobacteria bacterium]
MRPVVNPADLELKPFSNGEKFAVRIGEVGEALGLKYMGCMLHVVPAGKIAFPFHRHHECDELFLVLSGTGEYRFGEQRLPVKAGDCLSAPAGGEAHQIINTGSDELRYLGFSNYTSADVVEYPDSGKIGVRAGVKAFDLANKTFSTRGRVSPCDYWDGE